MFARVFGRVGMRGPVGSVAVCGVAIVMLVASSSAQAKTVGSVSCTGPTGGVTLPGNVTVPPGAFCFLQGGTVDGNVYIGSGARFTAIGAVIEGNVSSEGAQSIFVALTTVEGNASFDATSGTFTSTCGAGFSVCLADDQFGLGPSAKFGNVSITNTSPAGAFLGGDTLATTTTISHNLTCRGNSFINTSLFPVPPVIDGQGSGQCSRL